MDAAPLTIETLKTALAAFHAAHGSASPVVGIACCPQVEAWVKRNVPPARVPFGDIPMLVDPRMKVDASEVYYDRDAWRARCKEQRAWDAAPWAEKQNNGASRRAGENL